MFIFKTSEVPSGEPWKWLRQRPLFLLYWPGFRHKQEVAHRKEAIFFTAVAWTKTATSTYVLRCLMSATGYSVSNTTWKMTRQVCVLESCGHCLFLLPTKRPFPVAARDKPFCPFVFVLGGRSKHRVQHQDLWSVGDLGFRCQISGEVKLVCYYTGLHVCTLWP